MHFDHLTKYKTKENYKEGDFYLNLNNLRGKNENIKIWRMNMKLAKNSSVRLEKKP